MTYGQSYPSVFKRRRTKKKPFQIQSPMTQRQRLCLQLNTSGKGQKLMAESRSKAYSKLSSQLESFTEITLRFSFVNGFAGTLMFLREFKRASVHHELVSCDRLGNQTQDEEISLNFSYPGNGQTSLRQVDLALVAQELVAIRKNDFGNRFVQIATRKAYLTQECTIAFASDKAILKRDSQGSNKISCEVASWTTRKCCEVLQTIPPTMEMMRHAVLPRVKARFALRSAALHYDLDTRTAYTALTLAAGQSGGTYFRRVELEKSGKPSEKKNQLLGRLLGSPFAELCVSLLAIPMDDNSKKEEFSCAYIHAISAIAGFAAEPKSRPMDNAGIDVSITVPGEIEGVLSPKFDAQVKCTSRDLVRPGYISYPLPVINYNRLRHHISYDPQFLIVVLVPSDPQEWIDFSHEEILLRAQGYWLSLKGAEPTTNETTINVRVPLENAVTPESLQEIMRVAAEERLQLMARGRLS